MIVVSEIGEQWSPQTAPARQDAMEITIICPSGNTPITIGIRMLNVPQDVPVANARNAATRKMIIGRNPCIADAEFATRSATKYFAPSRFVIPVSKEDKVLQKLIREKQLACVVVDAPIVNSRTTSISIDQEQAQYDVAKKTVLDDNCKRVLYIAGRRDGYVTDQRLKGMKRLVKDLDLTMMVRQGDFSELTARNVALKYAKNKDVVVCASDLMAIGAMNALIDMDIFRPVCGFDGITLMGYVGKQMNTIRQDFYSISSRAVEEVHQLMNGGEGHQVIMPHSIVKMYYKDIIC